MAFSFVLAALAAASLSPRVDAPYCSNIDMIDHCLDPCLGLGGGTACQVNGPYNPASPPWNWNGWRCVCVSEGGQPAVCDSWKFIGCGTWCFMIWMSAGCDEPDPCDCHDLELESQTCYAVADCANAPGITICTNSNTDCVKVVTTYPMTVYVTGINPCCE